LTNIGIVYIIKVSLNDKALLERDSFMKDIEIGDFQEEEYETIYYELL